MTNLPKYIDDLIAIDTKWDKTQEVVQDKQAVTYSKDGSRVVNIHKLVEDFTLASGVRVICDDASEIDEEPLLDNVTLPESLVTIGERAFFMQQSMRHINIPPSVEIVKKQAFEQAMIKTLPEDNNIKVFGANSFSGSYLEGVLNIKSAVLIDDSAFMNTNISSVEFSDSLMEVGSCAFAGCDNLKSISFPQSVKHIGGGVVSGCSGLESVEFICDGYIFEDGVIYNTDKTELVSAVNIEGHFHVPAGVRTICEGAFYNSNITHITLPRSLKSIGKEAFLCSKLTKINIPDSVSEIGEGAFSYCYDLVKVKLPKKLKVISKETFNESCCIKEINMPLELTHIGTSAFTHCSKIKDIYLPESLVEIGEYAFAYCEDIKRINIPPKISEITDCAFIGTSIKSVIIPNSVVKIGCSAFADSTLQLVKLPESVKEIDETAFEYCNDITVLLKKQSTIKNIVKEALCRTKRFYFSDALIKYKILNERLKPKVFKNIDYLAMGCPSDLLIPHGTVKIAECALKECEELSSVVIPSTVTEIGEEAFNMCSGLKSIDIPDSVTNLNWGIFSFCSNLTSVKLPSGLKAIPPHMFFSCKSLVSLDIPNTVREIGHYAFIFCKQLEDITIPYGVTSIGDSAFDNCPRLKDIIIPDSVTYMGFSAFGECAGINSITLSRSLQEIDFDILYLSDVKCIKVYEECPVKDQIIKQYGSKVTVIK